MIYLLLALMLMFLTASKTYAHEHNQKTEDHFDLEGSGKKAILMVHFGTVKKETREKTLDALNVNVGRNFPEFQLREAYTSRRVIKKIYDKESIRKNTPTEALEKMVQEGFTHIIVQSTHIINGLEAEFLKEEVNRFRENFKDIRIGAPLLTSPEDYIETAEVLKMGFDRKEEAVVMVGHGTRHHSNSAYGMLQNVFRTKGMNNFYVGTIEGYPALGDVISELEKDGIKNIKLVPFMTVAGNHATKDIKEEWEKTLKEKGFKVKTLMKSMGEIPGIQHIFVNHIFECISYKREDTKLKKKNLLKNI